MFFLAINLSSKMKNKREFSFCLFVEKQPFFVRTKIIH
jgi:hypothetical protein